MTVFLSTAFMAFAASAAARSSSSSVYVPPAMGGIAYTPPTFGSVVSVLDFGAVGDAKTDNTASFTAAIAALNGTGGTVVVPSGQFAFDGSLVLPDGTSLVGTYAAVPSHDLRQTKGVLICDGSQLLPRGGAGNVSAQPFLTVGGNAAVRGFTILYPDQNASAAPVPYPWTISLAQKTNNAAVMDVELLNSYNGIQAVGAARHYIARVQGQPVNIGIYIDETYDIGRVENVHWNPWYSDSPAWLSWQDTQGTGFIIGRSDWEYVFNCFVFSMSIGYRFIESPDGDGKCNGNFVGIGADHTQNASVWVDAADAWGILIVNGEFTAFSAPPFGPTPADSSQVVITVNNTGSVRFLNCAFWGPSHTNARLYGSGKTAFEGCIFDEWDAASTGRGSVEAYGGQLLIHGSEWHAPGARHAPEVILFGPSANGTGVSKAILSDNLIDGTWDVVNNAGASVKLAQSNNLGD